MAVVMGTAGHIDHGKTTLIQALTGVDCDRLVEEKRRGITIELGFAELRLPDPASPDGTRSISVIDVPGHERFVHTMVAGASGVDFVLLVIAADEGVMPQTREHLEICSLLGISRGAVALTKIDMVDEELLALAVEDVETFLQGSILESAPVLPVSAHTGQGLQELRETLARLEAEFTPVRSHDLFRLPVDRIFTLHGHGTVVTGTMIAGSISLGETVRVYPGEGTSKVRGLQSHGSQVETAPAGRRTAVNLPDLAVEDIHRGDVISRPDTLFPATRWTAWVTCLPSSPRALRHRAEIHLHHGSREVQARLYFTDRDKLQPGESCRCEVRLPEPCAAVFGDKIVLRSFSPLRTVAGGVILNPLGTAKRRRDKNSAERDALMETLALTALRPSEQSAADKEQLVYVQLMCTEGAENGISFAELRALANLDSRVLEKILAALTGSRKVFSFDKTLRVYVADAFFNRLAEACGEAVKAYHERYTEKQGIKRSELISGWGKSIPPKLAHFILEQLGKSGALASEGEFIRLPSHTASFSGSQVLLSESLLSAHQEAGLAPPTLTALLETLNVTTKQAAPVLAALRSAGKLERVSDTLWYASEHVKTIESAVRDWFKTNESLDVGSMKTITGLTRKHTIPLLEYFDAQKVTMRVGDARILRDKGNN